MYTPDPRPGVTPAAHPAAHLAASRRLKTRGYTLRLKWLSGRRVERHQCYAPIYYTVRPCAALGDLLPVYPSLGLPGATTVHIH